MNTDKVSLEKRIEKYLTETYHPSSIIFCGSYQDGTYDEDSDFDCIILVKEKTARHDPSVICGVRLDCFIFTEEEAENEDAELFFSVHDGIIIADNGKGAVLKERVKKYVEEHRIVSDMEKDQIRQWISRAMKRMEKGSDEGNHEAAAFLWESLTHYCFLRDIFYFGSRKTINHLKNNDPDGYRIFHEAISKRTNSLISAWAEYVTSV